MLPRSAQNFGQRVQKSVFECLVDPAQWAQLRQSLIDEINPEQDSLRRVGYHFVLQEAEIPSKIRACVPFPIKLKWLDDGVAPVYEPCRVAVALLDEKDQVVQKQWLNGSNPRSWKPDESTTETISMTFFAVPPEDCKLAVGLFLNRQDASPAYRLGIKGRTADGWYVLSDKVRSVRR